MSHVVVCSGSRLGGASSSVCRRGAPLFFFIKKNAFARFGDAPRAYYHPEIMRRGATLLLAASATITAGRHNERPTATGAWKVPQGFRAYHLDHQLASAIATLLGRGRRNMTLLDMGAGKGLYVRFMRTAGMRNVTGYEGVSNIEEMTSGSIHQREFTQPFEPCVSYDVTMCLEVAEHIPHVHEPVFLRNLNCSARHGLVLSWAPPGQLGTGHVNLRSRAAVLKLLDDLGFVVDRAASRFLGEQATFTWFKKNMLALHRRGKPSPFEAANYTATLSSTSAKSLDSSTVLASLDHMRAAYAKIEARLDELHLAKSDVLLGQAMSEYRKALLKLSRVANVAGVTG